MSYSIEEYSVTHTGLSCDCIKCLKAISDTKTTFARFIKSIPCNENDFLSSHEEKRIPGDKSDVYLCKFHGVSLINYQNEQQIETIWDTLNKSIKSKHSRLKDVIGYCTFKFVCDKEMIGKTDNRNKWHMTLLKSNHFSLKECIAIVEHKKNND